MLVDMEKSVRKRVMLREKRETGKKFARREFEQEKERDTAVSSTHLTWRKIVCGLRTCFEKLNLKAS
jgi:hypothetical protein